jgi:2-polyprenyl-3-methyl-5-hydroxy-6-metoxy-1,4-benzoquinol methylase
MLQNIEKCPVCGEKETKLFLACKDYSVSKENFQIVQCKNCEFKFTNPIPTENTIGKYYQSENYVSHSDTKKGIINKVYHYVRNITLKKKLALVNNLTQKKNLLDIGCGTGYFLKTCKENGWKIDGTEPDENARKLAQENTKQEILPSIFSIEKTNHYDVISLWHVLEHIHKLNETLLKINVLLKEDGKIIIAVPNSDSKDAAYYNESWAAYDVPRHLYHFNQHTMKRLLNNYGFHVEKTIPMKYDSYYVSMMSEGYKSDNQTFKYIKAIINGWKSNFYGLINNNNYSSIIYIASKKIE